MENYFGINLFTLLKTFLLTYTMCGIATKRSSLQKRAGKLEP
jgi:hypothetical protein